MRDRHFPGTKEMKACLDDAIAVARERWTTFSKIRLTNSLVAFLVATVTAHQNANRRRRDQRFRGVVEHIEAHLDEADQLTVDALARVAGISTSRFKALFKRETGVPPAEFALRARVHEAARRLQAGGATVTEVAFGLGFSSSQYFASVFQRFTNSRPSDYLRRSGADGSSLALRRERR
jgi:AraC-like DNA-binding protein